MDLRNNKVAIHFTKSKGYSSNMPFHPPQSYPEISGEAVDRQNEIYDGVRDLLRRLDLDKDNFNTNKWNPFKGVIEPGMTVFIKPNTVSQMHENGKDIFSVIVHASILRPILDYVCIALKDQGKIIIGDSPLITSDFQKAFEISGIQELLDWYRKQTSIPIEFFDLRNYRAVRTWLYGRWGRKNVENDPLGYEFVDCGEESSFRGMDPKRLRIAVANYKNMIKHHSNGRHEYLFPKSFLESDVVISIPKLKTHRRTAVTLALKNFMGIPSWKDSLPHFVVGSPAEGGDQYINPSLRKEICTRLHDQIQSNPWIPAKFACAVIKKLIWNSHKLYPFQDDIFEGMWYGNDTLWRTLLDLNKAVFYADKSGVLRNTVQRRFFCLIDGIIGGAKDGPLSPDPVDAGVLIAGFNPVAVDTVGATIMGFDIKKIPLIWKIIADRTGKCPIFFGNEEAISIREGSKAYSLKELTRKNLGFEPHPGWKGHVELE